jgi:hypothetical protein
MFPSARKHGKETYFLGSNPIGRNINDDSNILRSK